LLKKKNRVVCDGKTWKNWFKKEMKRAEYKARKPHLTRRFASKRKSKERKEQAHKKLV